MNATENRKKVIGDALASMRLIDGAPTPVKDAPEALGFLVSQLTHIENGVFEKGRQPMQYQSLVPVSTEAGEYAQSITYEMYDYSGRGRKTSGKGKDINRVDVAYGQKTFQVFHGNVGYDYTQEELRVSAYLRKPLNERRAAAAMEAYERHINDVALNGEAESGITGLFNNATVPQANVPNGAAASPLWANKTPLEILKDFNTAFTTVWSNTQYNEMPNGAVIAPDQYSYIATTPVSSTQPDKTILAYVKENCLPKQQANIDVDIQPGWALKGGGAGGTNRFMVYTKSNTKLVMHLPLPFRFLAPQPVGLSVEVPGEYKYSGVEFRYPKSAAYFDGI